jgi:hypothetical protein
MTDTVLNNSKIQRPISTGLTPSDKNPKNELKSDNPRSPNQNYPTHNADAANHLCHHA